MQDAQSGPRDNPAASDEGGTVAAAPGPFVVTKEHRRFAEFADAVRRDRYIGLCYGPPGVGKTLSAQHYAHWDAAATYLAHRQQATTDRFMLRPPEGLDTARTVFWTAPVAVTATQISRNLLGWCEQVDTAIRRTPTGWRR